MSREVNETEVRPDVATLDWDTLIILDAARYDLFKWCEKVGTPGMTYRGSVEKHISRGSNTMEFMQRNFNDPPHNDIVYVNANPTASRSSDSDDFHVSIPFWTKLWDEDLNTVPPQRMAQAVLESHQRFPNKRIVAHFSQPHLPFIGRLGQIFKDSQEFQDMIRGMQDIEDMEKTPEMDPMLSFPWRASYLENLQIGLMWAHVCAEKVDGKVVTTSDHGERLGQVPDDMGMVGTWMGHAEDADDAALREIPWLEHYYDERRDIVSSEYEGEGLEPTDEEIEERMKALGYLP